MLKLNLKFSGHETFVCRYSWLSKVVQGLEEDSGLFKDEDMAMVQLGVGKNMVRSAKYWAEAAEIIVGSPDGHSLTEFGSRLLGSNGLDSYLERIETLWLIHWKFSTNISFLSYYWFQMMNHWHRSEFTTEEAERFLNESIPAGQKKPSSRTIQDGLKVFINTYTQTKGRKGEVTEDHLDSPLVDLNLLRETKLPNGSVYSFNLERKIGISNEVFAYCLNDYWNALFPDADQLEFSRASSGEGGPGQIFKLPELEVRSYLDSLENVTSGNLKFVESSSLQQIIRQPVRDLSTILLERIYSN